MSGVVHTTGGNCIKHDKGVKPYGIKIKKISENENPSLITVEVSLQKEAPKFVNTHRINIVKKKFNETQ